MARTPLWTKTLGNRPHVVRLYERGPNVWIYYRSEGSPVRRSLGRGIRTPNGKLDPAGLAWALDQGKAMLGMLLLNLSPSKPKPSPTIRQSITLVSDPDRGLYPSGTQHRQEVLRSLHFACKEWGDKNWRDVDQADFTALGRAKVRALHAAGHQGYRGAEGLVKQVLTVGHWLRDRRHIPSDAGRADRDWRKALKAFWRTYVGAQADYKESRPRFNVDEYRRLLTAAWGVDPRFGLMADLGAGFRFGQVRRIRRSDVDLVNNRVTIPGVAGKQGAVVHLTSGQADALKRALAGHLGALEARWLAEGVDYSLFPQGRLPASGVILRDAGMVSRPCLTRWFCQAEKLAGIAHVEGRGAHGLRRLSVDDALSRNVSPTVLQASGGWASPDVPMKVYAEHNSKEALVAASKVRGELRGEVGPACTPSVQMAPEEESQPEPADA